MHFNFLQTTSKVKAFSSWQKRIFMQKMITCKLKPSQNRTVIKNKWREECKVSICNCEACKQITGFPSAKNAHDEPLWLIRCLRWVVQTQNECAWHDLALWLLYASEFLFIWAQICLSHQTNCKRSKINSSLKPHLNFWPTTTKTTKSGVNYGNNGIR